MSGYRLSKEASEDLVAIYIQGHDQFGPRQADRYQDELDALFRRLAASPGMSRLRLEYDPPVRALAFKAHVIIYDQEPDGVLIQRVRHGHEDWQGDPHGSSDERSEP
ncbi:type II toxin-antitoxin system RelE/ParE family toxin [Brevundimonas sp. DWR2-3-1b1]|uniref:type II toxin-antitoxin system RelE/ParE family toxin n=1 Tax=unclassified Brevundimonas TaxID=2622653 RepID=UPI003CEDB8CC